MFEIPLAFDIASSAEGPARSTRSLVFDRSDSSLLFPVPDIGSISTGLIVGIICKVLCIFELEVFRDG